MNNLGLKVENDDAKLVEYKLEPPKFKPVIKIPDINKIEKKKDNDEDFTETIIDVIDIDKPVELTKFIEDPIKEDVEFIAVEFAPLFPDCKGKSENELKSCFTSNIGKFVNINFNSKIAQDIGLSSGIKRIYTEFKIDDNGNVVGIRTRSIHKALEKEAARVIDLLPKMTPGKQGTRSVTIRYSLPIVFKVE